MMSEKLRTLTNDKKWPHGWTDEVAWWYDRWYNGLTIRSNGLKNGAHLTYLWRPNQRQLIKVWHSLVIIKRVPFQVALEMVFEKISNNDEKTQNLTWW